jgi:hypothetical protein
MATHVTSVTAGVGYRLILELVPFRQEREMLECAHQEKRFNAKNSDDVRDLALDNPGMGTEQAARPLGRTYGG